MTRRVVLLPGLDGTGALFDAFVRSAPASVRAEVVALPHEAMSYAQLCARLAPTLRLTPDTLLVAESFSGPLAVLLAERYRVRGLVLCNSFVEPPRTPALALLARPIAFRLTPPKALVRRFLVGERASDGLVDAVRAAVASVPAAVLASRVREVLHANVAASLARCSAPLLYLRGTRDRVVTETSVQWVVRAASSEVRVARIDGPHLLLQTEPEAAWRAIADAGLLVPA